MLSLKRNLVIKTCWLTCLKPPFTFPMTTNPEKERGSLFWPHRAAMLDSPPQQKSLRFFFSPPTILPYKQRDKKQCLFQNMYNKSVHWIPEIHLDIAVTNNTKQLIIFHSLDSWGEKQCSLINLLMKSRVFKRTG